MIDLIVGFIAGLVILTGLAIIVGPDMLSRLPGLRWLKRLSRVKDDMAPAPSPAADPPALHPNTRNAMVAAVRLAGALAESGHPDPAATLQDAARQLPQDEEGGLLRIHATCRALRRQSDLLPPPLLRQLARLEATVTDRCEQLELIPYL